MEASGAQGRPRRLRDDVPVHDGLVAGAEALEFGGPWRRGEYLLDLVRAQAGCDVGRGVPAEGLREEATLRDGQGSVPRALAHA